MTTRVCIVTGSSRGLGRALVEQLLEPGSTVLGIARQRVTALDDLAAMRGAVLLQWPLDLQDGPTAAANLRTWLASLDGTAMDSVTLINNAAFLNTPAPLDRADDASLSAALRVGLEAPLLLSAAFLDGTRHWPGKRQLMNISSGLGRRAMAGSAAYCAIKAGMDHFTRAVALEQATQANGARVESVAPGVIDTDMQQQLRGADAGLFPERALFANLHDQGQLASPAAAAAQLLARLQRPSFGAAPVTDIRSA